MIRCRIVADDKIPFLKGVLESAGASVKYIPGAKIAREDLLEADALIVRTRTFCGQKLLDGTPVKAVATATIGTDHVDTGYLAANNISFASAKGCNAPAVACYVASALVHFDKPFCGRTLGIIGKGNVGSIVMEYASALGYRIKVCDPPRARIYSDVEYVTLQELLRESDAVTCHVPLSFDGDDATAGMANRDFFSAMKPGGLFINASRGGVVCEKELLEKISAGRISAVLDVWNNEPEINRELLDACLLATPHIAGYSLDGKAAGTAMSVRFISRIFGLGLDDWPVPELPPPPEKVIDAGGVPAAECMGEIMDRVYDFRQDDTALRRAPGNFEKIRGNYPPRRDFSACRIINHAVNEYNIWKKSGFAI